MFQSHLKRSLACHSWKEVPLINIYSKTSCDASWSSSPFCLWIGLELVIVVHFEEGKFCLIGCEERWGVKIEISAGTGSVLHTRFIFMCTWAKLITHKNKIFCLSFYENVQMQSALNLKDLNIAFTYQHHMLLTCSHHEESTFHHPLNSLPAHSSEIMKNKYHY